MECQDQRLLQHWDLRSGCKSSLQHGGEDYFPVHSLVTGMRIWTTVRTWFHWETWEATNYCPLSVFLVQDHVQSKGKALGTLECPRHPFLIYTYPFPFLSVSLSPSIMLFPSSLHQTTLKINDPPLDEAFFLKKHIKKALRITLCMAVCFLDAVLAGLQILFQWCCGQASCTGCLWSSFYIHLP